MMSEKLTFVCLDCVLSVCVRLCAETPHKVNSQIQPTAENAQLCEDNGATDKSYGIPCAQTDTIQTLAARVEDWSTLLPTSKNRSDYYCTYSAAVYIVRCPTVYVPPPLQYALAIVHLDT